MILQSTRSYVVRLGNWKLALCPGSGCPGQLGNRPTQEQAWKKALADFGSQPQREDLKKAPFVQLFDMENDPRENTNLAAKKPDLVNEMIALLERNIANGRSTEGPQLKDDVPQVNILFGVPKFVRMKETSR